MAQDQAKTSGNPSPDEFRVAAAERDRVRDPQRGHALIDYILETEPENPEAALEAALLGSPDTLLPGLQEGDEPFWSVKARQLDLLSFLLGRLIAELEKNELYPLWTSGGPDFDRDVARAIWQLGGSDMAPEMHRNLPAPAMTMAKVIHRFVDIARKAQNEEGGYHHVYPGALISGGHDWLKLRRAGKPEWIAFIRPLLDDRTFEDVDPDKLLDVAWDTLDLNQDLKRHLYFKDADGWTEYNLRFGFVTLREAVVAAIERAARRAGMSAVFGTDPDHTLQGVLHALETARKTRIAPEARARLKGLMASLAPNWQFSLLDGAVERDITRVGREALIDLGVALFPEPEDMPALSKAVPFQGRTLFEAIDVELAGFASGEGISAPGRRSDFTLAIAGFGEALNAALADRFVALDNPPGRTVELLRQFLKLNVTYWWAEVMRRAALMSLGGFLGQALRGSFSQVDPAFAATLSQYGVDASAFEAIRAAHGVVPAGNDSSETALSAARERLDAWLWDRLIAVALAPDEPGHARFMRGAGDFTAEGELLRFMAQFRELRAPFLPKPHGTAELREADRVMYEAMARGDGLPALTNLLIWTMLFARLSRFAFDLVEGKSPPVGKDEWPWFDVGMVGGALGFCADLLFGDTTGIKAVPLSAFATLNHPAVDSALRIWREARDAEDVRAALATWADKEGDAGRLDTLQVTRQALNYALLHQLQDMMSPGYLPRTVKDMQARTADAYWRMPGARDPSDGGGKPN